jgi:hypothetical protein
MQDFVFVSNKQTNKQQNNRNLDMWRNLITNQLRNENHNTNKARYECSICFRIVISLLNKPISLHTKFAAVAHLAEGQYVRATENRVKFLTLGTELLE